MCFPRKREVHSGYVISVKSTHPGLENPVNSVVRPDAIVKLRVYVTGSRTLTLSGLYGLSKAVMYPNRYQRIWRY